MKIAQETTNGISLIIVTNNRERDLEFTLSTLKDLSTTCNYEVLVVDNCSHDNTKRICVSCGLKNLRYYRTDRNLGVAGGRNYGAKLARYEYMVFIDDDAHFTSDDAIENAYNVMSSTSYGIYAFGTLLRDGTTPYMWTYKQPVGTKSFETSTFIGCAHGIKKSCFEVLGGYSNDLMWGGEENELVMKAFSRNMGPVRYEDSVKVIHRISPKSKDVSTKIEYFVCRNRLYLIRKYFPFSFGLFAFAFAVRNFLFFSKCGHAKDCLKGVRDSFRMKCDGKYRMNYRQTYKYISMK